MRMAQADRVAAVVFLALGLAMLAGGWTMDRLEARRIHPASIPGLVPMILGGLMALCAVLQWAAASKEAARDAAPFLVDGSWSRLALTGGTCLAYALLLVGWLPFLWSTFVFVTVFALVFSWPEGPDLRARAKAVLSAVVLGMGIAFGTATLFAEVFLVRLP